MKLQELTSVSLDGFDLPQEVLIGRGVKSEVGNLAEKWLGRDPLILGDRATLSAFGPIRKDFRTVELDTQAHADDATVAAVAEALYGHSGILAVGSGTVNDVAKRASSERGVPYVVCGTAASMNGYASGIAAILSHGLKITLPSAPPRAILLDTEVLSLAPARLAQAGLGDLMSKPVSDADWWLANELEGTGYSTIPGSVVDQAVNEAAEVALGLAAGECLAHGALGKALVLSGVAMVLAGSSAPASGGEHLISHLWDMENHVAHRPTRLHGAQVGVATCISAALYQRLLKLDKPVISALPRWEKEAERIRKEHGLLADVILPQAKRKHDRAAARRELLKTRWTEIRSGLADRNLPTPASIRKPLLEAGAPSRLSDLKIERADTARVFRLARDIRDRITVLDVGFELGILPGAIEEILDEAGV